MILRFQVLLYKDSHEQSFCLHRTRANNMYQKMKSTSYPLMALSLLALCKTVTSYKVHTRIVNHLCRRNSINVHCKSGNDDLGLNTVRDGGEYRFRFHINFTGKTLFYCTVSSKLGRIDFDTFDTLEGLVQVRSRVVVGDHQARLEGLQSALFKLGHQETLVIAKLRYKN